MKKVKELISSLLVVATLLTAIPLSGFVGLKTTATNLFPALKANAIDGQISEDYTYAVDSAGNATTTEVSTGFDRNEAGKNVVSKITKSIDEITTESTIIKKTVPTTKPTVERTTERITEATTTPSTESATSGKCGDNLNWDFDKETGTLTISGTGKMYGYNYGYYHISGVGFYVTSAPWREYFLKIRSVIIGDKVACVGGNAFYGCFKINYISVPASIYYSYNSFYRCTNISLINITKGIENDEEYNPAGSQYDYYSPGPWTNNPSAEIIFDSDVENIRNCMFYGCKFSSFTLPDSIKNIGVYAFGNCKNLQSITIPDSVENIADGAFSDCTKLKTVNLGNNPSLELKYSIFNGCDSLEQFMVGSKNQNYSTDDNGVLYNKNKTGLIKYPAKLKLTSYAVNTNTKYINEHAFENNVNLEHIVLPEDMKSIGSYAFKGCTSIKEAIIPDGLITLCYSAFEGCSSIEKIVLPESLQTLGGYSFKDCFNLKEVTYNCQKVDSITNGCSPFYNAGSESGGFTLTFTDSVRIIPNELFSNALSWSYSVDYRTDVLYPYYWSSNSDDYYVTEINIGKNVCEAGPQSFVNINNLKKVNYNATDCLKLSFINCKNLDEVKIGDNVKTIPARFLYGCESVCSIVLPQGVTRIGVDSITGTKYYNSPENWNNDELRIDNKLIKVNPEVTGRYIFDPDVTVVADKAFLNSEITEVSIPSRIITLGFGCFENAVNLKEVSFNPTECQYAEEAFYASGVNKFTIGNNVTRLPEKMLTNCDNISELLIPESVVYMGEELFGYKQTVIRFLGEERINIMNYSDMYRPRINAIIYCRQNSYIHSFLTMKAAPFYLYNDTNDIFKIENDVLEKYTGKSKNIFVNFASKIGYGAFEDNEDIESVELSSGVTTIFNAAFKNCKNLKSVIVPQSVSSIGNSAFDGSENLSIWCYAGSFAESFAKNKNIEINYITLKLSEPEVTLNANESRSLKASFSTVINDDNTITWSSDNTSVVKVSSNGELTAIGKGTARITAKSDSGLCATCIVKVSEEVKESKVNSVSIDDISLNYKKSTTLKPQIDADNGVKYTVKYSSSNTKVATVDKNGKVTATKRGSGSATITCTVTDEYGNTVTDTCKVSVKLSFGQILITYILFGWIWY